MKLYTENEVKKAMLIYHNGLTIDYVFSKLKHIELPNDEDIENTAKKNVDGLFCEFEFIDGAKWVIDEIVKQVIS